MNTIDLWLGLVDAAIEVAVQRPIDGKVDASTVQQAAYKLSTIAQDEEAPGFMARLAARFSLSPLDELALWTLVAHQIRPNAATRLSALAGGTLDVGTLASVAYGGMTNAALSSLCGPHGLVRNALIEVGSATNNQTLVKRSVRLADRILRIAVGADLEVADLACEVSFHDEDLDMERTVVVREVSELVVDPAAVERVRDAIAANVGLVLASAIAGSGRRALLVAVAVEAGRKILCLDARYLDRDRERATSQLRAFARECGLADRVPLIANVDALRDENDERLDWVMRELDERIPGLILATCALRVPTLRLRRPCQTIAFGRPTATQRLRQWQAIAGESAVELAQRYPFAPALVHRIGEGLEAGGRLASVVHGVVDGRLSQYATRIACTQTWQDLVLPPDLVDALAELRARIRGRAEVYEAWGFGNKLGRGLGISALFSGPPGTGKTMVASLLASEIGLEIYQVDLGKIVSKYIGETEKNLAALFDAAEASCAPLLFDEADSLFGKRTEVKSSNDRWANLETNYLLQRLETFHGICLLTTNHESSIDEAFQRRLSMHLRFEMPDLAERKRLWTAVLPTAAPLGADIDFNRLASRYEMSGGYIKNAALRAAFIACDKGSPISANILESAARREYEAMGKLPGHL